MAVVISFFTPLLAQNPQIKFGNVTAADFKVSSPVVKEDDQAVILANIGSTNIEGNNNGYFSLIFKKHKRILLRNRAAFDLATVKEEIYKGGNTTEEEKFEDFDAATYTLENGQVVATKLDKTSILTEKYNKVINVKKFTFPNLKEGCIIEYTYTIKSPFQYFMQHMRGWYFQSQYPVMWSEYQVTIPPMFNYLTLTKGVEKKFTIDSSKKIFKRYSVLANSGTAMGSSQVYDFSGDAQWHLWAMKDLPAFKKEEFISSLSNYYTRLQFQLINIKYCEDCGVTQIMKSWPDKVDELMKNEDFGLPLTADNNWLNDEIKRVAGNSSGYDLAKKIYEYVRDKFLCKDHDALYLSAPLKKTFQTKSGNVADINLLLTAMLHNAGFSASPVILSTRDNGLVDETMPLLNQYNYVISRVQIDSTYILLDASQNKLGFGKLSEDCYNGSGRLIEPMPYLIPLSADALKEAKQTVVFMANDSAGKMMECSFTSNLGNSESFNMRERIIDNSKKEELFKKTEKAYSFEASFQNETIDSLKMYEEPVSIKYDMKINLGDEDIIYFSPMFTEAYKENPFKSAERLYPVEMNYASDEIFNLNMEVPKGYKVDELPKSTRVKLNDDEGMFEYIIINKNDNIQLRCRLVLYKATFLPEDYQTLRDFFAFVVKKQAEQIVFKKIK
jgi:hypothetical protein